MRAAFRLASILAFTLISLQPAGAIAQTRPTGVQITGKPYTGSIGFKRSVAEIMALEAGDAGKALPEPMLMPEFEHERDDLPQNPASPAVSSIPALPPGMLEQLGNGNQVLSPQVVGTNFTGATLSGVNPTSAFPPDNQGAVGPSQYVVAVNNRIVSFNKTTGVADGVINTTTNTFFTTVRNASGTSDPRVRYDRLTGRWFLLIINVSTPNRILIAVSDAASAGVITGSTVFTYFFIPIATTSPPISSTCLADYPTLGIDANALYVGTNNFCGTPTQTFNSTDGYVIRKSSILGAGPIVVTVFRGLVANASSAGPYTPQGVDNFAPASNEGFFIGVDNLTFGTLMMRRVSNPGGTPAISANISITVPATASPLTVQHLGNTGGTNGRLDALDDRLFAAHLRNGRLWTAHNIGVDNTGSAAGTTSRDGSRWYELAVPAGAGTPTIVQSGTVFAATAGNTTDQRNYFIPSIMVSGQGHSAVGFSTAGTNERINASTVGRLSGDALGAMQTPVLFTSSATAYNPTGDTGAGRGARRWGDYSYTSLDPLDDMTMWTVEQFCDASNSYGVRVAKLIAPAPATPSVLADVTAGQATVNVTLTGAVVAGSGFYDPGANLPGVPAFNHIAVAASNGGATGTPPTVVSATYVNPTTLDLVLNASAATANIGAEKYTLTVTNPDGQTAAAAVLHVVGGTPTVSIGSGPSQNEGNAGLTPVNFTVTLSATTPNPVTVNYQTSNGSATIADSDYQAATSSIVIPANTPSGTITVNVVGDPKNEPNETFTVTLTGATNATLGSPVVSTATIVNDDPIPTATVAGASAPEGNVGSTPLAFAVTLSNPSSQLVTVNYQTVDGSATVADADYAAATSSIGIPAGSTSGSIAVNLVGDTKHESNETFSVNLTGATNATVGSPGSATGTLVNDDPIPSISIADANVAEGNAGTTALAFTLTLSNLTDQAVQVATQTSDGTATLANSDYQSASGIVSIPPGTITAAAVIQVNGDLKFEPNETLLVDLSAPVNATIGDGQGIGTISNDDGQPSVSIDDVKVVEGDAGTVAAVFTIGLSNPSAAPVSVDFQTGDGTATLDNDDYRESHGTVTIPAKSLAATVTVLVNGDTKFETGETFTVNLSNAVSASIGDAQGVGTISNDDGPPSVSIDDLKVVEGDAGTVDAVFTISLSNASATPVSVDFQTADGTATLANNDYEESHGTAIIPAKELATTITVLVSGDTKFEAGETFTLYLSNAVNATIGDGQGVGTISNDDGQPSVSIDDVKVVEGDAGTVAAVFTVGLSNPSATPVSVDFQTVDGTATLDNDDYRESHDTVTIPAKSLAATVTVLVNGDTKFETGETFTVNLSNAVSASIGDAQGVGTISNDDDPPSVSIDNLKVVEGNAGAIAAVFTVSLSNSSGEPVSVDFQTTDGTATLANSDYVENHGTVIIPAKELSASVTVMVNGDTKFEGDESYTVVLSNPVNATIGAGTGNGTISDDDSEPSLAIDDVKVVEGDAGTITALFTVSLSNASAIPVSVDYQTNDGTATIANNDYVESHGTITIPAKGLSATIAVTVNGDGTFESNETFAVDLANGVNVSIGDGEGVGTISNDDEGEAPVVHVEFPNGGELLAIGQKYVFEWTATDNVGVTDVDLQLSRDNGTSYETLALGEPNDGLFSWTAAPPPTVFAGLLEYSALFHVTAHDAAGNAGEDTSDDGFAINGGVATIGDAIVDFSLSRVVPNPTGIPIHFDYALPRRAEVRVSIVDLQGREIAVVAQGAVGPGHFHGTWNTQTERGAAPAGLYFVRYRTPGRAMVRRFAIVR